MTVRPCEHANYFWSKGVEEGDALVIEDSGGYSVVGPEGIAYGGEEERHCVKQSKSSVVQKKKFWMITAKKIGHTKPLPRGPPIYGHPSHARIFVEIRAKILLWRQNLVN